MTVGISVIIECEDIDWFVFIEIVSWLVCNQ